MAKWLVYFLDENQPNKANLFPICIFLPVMNQGKNWKTIPFKPLRTFHINTALHKYNAHHHPPESHYSYENNQILHYSHLHQIPTIKKAYINLVEI